MYISGIEVHYHIHRVPSSIIYYLSIYYTSNSKNQRFKNYKIGIVKKLINKTKDTVDIS